MANVSFCRCSESRIKQLQEQNKVDNDTLYASTDSGMCFMGMPNNVLLPLTSSAEHSLSLAAYIVAEGDTADGIWHYRFYSNGYVDYDGRVDVKDVYFNNRTWNLYGANKADVVYPDYPVMLSKITFKKAECAPVERKYITSTGQNLLSTLSSAPYLTSDKSKATAFGVVNCFRGSMLDENHKQTIAYCVKTSGYAAYPSEVAEMEQTQKGLYAAKVLQAVSAYNSTAKSQQV